MPPFLSQPVPPLKDLSLSSWLSPSPVPLPSLLLQGGMPTHVPDAAHKHLGRGSAPFLSQSKQHVGAGLFCLTVASLRGQGLPYPCGPSL